MLGSPLLLLNQNLRVGARALGPYKTDGISGDCFIIRVSGPQTQVLYLKVSEGKEGPGRDQIMTSVE